MSSLHALFVEIISEQESNTLLHTKIAFINLFEIGTHENIDKAKITELKKSIDKNGYQGPPIAIFQSGSDTVYDMLHEGINNVNISTGVYGDFGIADGHNRLAILKEITRGQTPDGILIPVQIIPAHNPSVIRISTAKKAEQPLTIAQVEACFKDTNLIIPTNSTSHFQARRADDTWGRVRESQPVVRIIFKQSL